MFSKVIIRYPDSLDLTTLMDVIALNKSKAAGSVELKEAETQRKRFLVSAFMIGLQTRHDLTVALMAYELIHQGEHTGKNQPERLSCWENEGGYIDAPT